METAATAPSPPSHLPQPSTSTGITSQGSKKKARRQVARKIATQFLLATPHSEESDVETSQSVEFQEALAYQGCHTAPPVEQVARKSASPRHKAPLETHKPHIPASYARGHREHSPPRKHCNTTRTPVGGTVHGRPLPTGIEPGAGHPTTPTAGRRDHEDTARGKEHGNTSTATG